MIKQRAQNFEQELANWAHTPLTYQINLVFQLIHQITLQN